jgi:hypothetical protein
MRDINGVVALTATSGQATACFNGLLNGMYGALIICSGALFLRP